MDGANSKIIVYSAAQKFAQLKKNVFSVEDPNVKLLDKKNCLQPEMVLFLLCLLLLIFVFMFEPSILRYNRNLVIRCLLKCYRIK